MAEAEEGTTYETACYTAASDGRLDVLKKLLERGGPFDPFAASVAAFNGRLDVLKWLHEREYLDLSWDLCDDAASGGQMDTLRWVHEQGFPWSNRTLSAPRRGEHLYGGGHLDVLTWAKALEGPIWDYIRAHSECKDGCVRRLVRGEFGKVDWPALKSTVVTSLDVSLSCTALPS
jgi:hypothetical protein